MFPNNVLPRAKRARVDFFFLKCSNDKRDTYKRVSPLRRRFSDVCQSDSGMSSPSKAISKRRLFKRKTVTFYRENVAGAKNAPYDSREISRVTGRWR